MFKVKIFLTIMPFVILTALADPVLPVPTSPGYVNSVYGGILKSAYGVCFHTSYFTPDEGVKQCGELPNVENPKSKLTTKIVLEKKIVTESEVILFAFNSNNLTSNGMQYLNKIADGFKRESDIVYLTIEGYTDKLGKSSYNLKLSQKRANSVRNFFINEGFNDKMISANGLGENETGISDKCLAQYGSDIPSQMDSIKAILNERRFKSHMISKEIILEKSNLLNKLNVLQKAYNNLLNCTAFDRKVIFTIKRAKVINELITPANGVISSKKQNSSAAV